MGQGRQATGCRGAEVAPRLDAIQPMPFPVMRTLLDAAVPDGNQSKYDPTSFFRVNQNIVPAEPMAI
jgi:hypothetical protein